jgi:hypothetical protein
LVLDMRWSSNTLGARSIKYWQYLKNSQNDIRMISYVSFENRDFSKRSRPARLQAS